MSLGPGPLAEVYQGTDVAMPPAVRPLGVSRAA